MTTDRRCGAEGVDEGGRCKRCGLLAEEDRECPPGFFGYRQTPTPLPPSAPTPTVEETARQAIDEALSTSLAYYGEVETANEMARALELARRALATLTARAEAAEAQVEQLAAIVVKLPKDADDNPVAPGDALTCPKGHTVKARHMGTPYCTDGVCWDDYPGDSGGTSWRYEQCRALTAAAPTREEGERG